MITSGSASTIVRAALPATWRRAYTAVEVAIVLLIVGLIVGALWPQLQGGLQRRRQQSAFYQQLLQLNVERYRDDHQGRPPSCLTDLTRGPATKEGPDAGPYLPEIPLEPLSGSAEVWPVGHQGPRPTRGWLYWPESGRVEAAAATMRSKGQATAEP